MLSSSVGSALKIDLSSRLEASYHVQLYLLSTKNENLHKKSKLKLDQRRGDIWTKMNSQLHF